MRRLSGVIAAVCFLLALPGGASAQEDYPNRPVRVVIGFAAGSGADLMCRWFTAKLGEVMTQSVVIENKPGAFASIAHNVVANARPDGYTVLLTGNALMAGGRFLIKDMPFGPNSFTPVGMMTETPFVLTVAASSPAKSVADLVALLKSKTRNRHGYANVTGLVAGTYFKELTGVVAEPVSYRVATDAVPDVENGTLDFMIIDGAFSVGPVRAGKLRVLAVTSEEHVAVFPGAPTMAEAGYPKFNFSPWWAAYFPPATPQPLVDKFAAALTTVVKLPETAKYLETIAVLPLVGDPLAIRKRLQADSETWDWLAKVANVQPQ